MMKIFPLLASLILTGFALLPAASVAAGSDNSQTAAPPVETGIQCVPLRMIERTKIVDDSTILFEMKSGKVYRNNLRQSCNGLKRGDRFAYKTSSSQLCSMDIITVVRSMGIAGPSCGLGDFVPVTPTAK